MFDENIALVLTTRGRINMQFTLQNLCDDVLKYVIIICYPGEEIYHRKNWGGKVLEVIEHPNYINNIDQIREWVIKEFGFDYILFMDDNLNFHVRRKSDKGNDCKFPLHQLCDKHYTDETIRDIQIDMFRWAVNRLKSDQYGIVGFSARSGNQRVEEDEVENTRTYAFWGINCKMFREVEIDYNIDDFKFKGDLYTFIFMLSKGFKNIVSYRYAFDKTGGANNKGGCSIYRNNDLITHEAHLLYNKFPDFVRLNNKKSKSWKNVDDEIIDVIIYWKKAYEFGIKNKL